MAEIPATYPREFCRSAMQSCLATRAYRWMEYPMSRTINAISLFMSLAAVILSSWALIRGKNFDSDERVIVARGLIIQDASGRMRIALGAPVPDPVVRGKTARRIAPASGLLLLGPDGNERGGYLTTDHGGEAVLTLDSGNGSTEVFKAVANANAGASLFIIHQNGAGAMLTTYKGEPELQLIDRQGATRFSAPSAQSLIRK